MENDKIKKRGFSKAVIILVILTVIAIGAGYAWAKYISSQNGDAEAQIAKWSFKVVDGDSSTIDVLDFPVTRTDNNTEVDRSTIAPGTYGKFEIDIDARGTETILTYEINIGFTNKPTNMKFYSDEAMTNEITLSNGRLIRTGFLSLSDVNYIQPQVIYWNWPLETGTSAAEIAQNDIIDSDFIGKTLTMAITVKGTQAVDYASAENVASVTTFGGTTTNYLTVQEAVTVAKSNNESTITLLKDRAVDGITIGENENVTLNLNGKTLFLNGSLTNNGTLTVTGAGKVTSSSTTITNNGDLTLTQGQIHSSTSNGNAINNYGTLEVVNATVLADNTSATKARAIWNYAGGKLSITGTNALVSGVTHSIVNYDTSTDVLNPAINITNGTIIASSSGSYGILNYGGSIVMTNGNVIGNYAICNADLGTVANTIKITGGTVRGYGNTSDSYAIKIKNSTKGKIDTLILGENGTTGPTITCPTSAILLKVGNLQMYSGNISTSAHNKYAITSTNHDGGVAVTITGGTISAENSYAIYSASGTGDIIIGTQGSNDNSAVQLTGGIYSEGLDLNFYSGTLEAENTDGIYSNSNINITGGHIKVSENGIGQAIQLGSKSAGKTLNISGNPIIENESSHVTIITTSGQVATIIISGGTISANTHRAITVYDSNLTITGNAYISNNSDKYAAIRGDGGEIVVKASANSNNSSETVGPIISSSKRPGINLRGGTLTIGVDESTPSVNTTIPSIKGGTYGVQISSGTFNFYDGIIKGKTNAIDGTPNTPTGYTTSPETTDAQGYKTVTLTSN